MEGDKDSNRQLLIASIGAISAVVAALASPICSSLINRGKPAAPAVVVSPAVLPGQAPPVTPTSEEPTGSSPSIEGAWKQYVLVPGGGSVYLGTYVVSRYHGEYVVSPRSQSEGPEVLNTIGVFDVAYDGERLTFNSNWGNGMVGNFDLEQISPTVFEGEIRVAGQVANLTRLVKVE